MRLRRLLLGFFLVCLTAPFWSAGLRLAIADEPVGDTMIVTDTADPGDTITSSGRTTTARPVVYTLTIDGPIGVVTNDRISDAIEEATAARADMLLIYLDTPGGLMTATQDINKQFLNAEIPICVFVAPQGARAGSAGVFVTYAAHIAAMAPSTNIGAAHPVGAGGEQPDSVMNEKVTNDAVAQILALAEKRGRNADFAERAVRNSESIPYNVALDSNVIDIVAEGTEDLLAQIHGRTVELPDGEVEVLVEDAQIVEIETSFAHQILDIITDPSIAFLLFSIGGLGIVLELYNPGAIFPGVIGAISLILAFYAFQTLPINYAGVALIILAIILFIAEIKVTSGGLLTIGGLAALFFGGLMLIDTDVFTGAMRVSLEVLITTVVGVGIAVGGALYLVVKAARKQVSTGQQGLIGKTATVRPNGFVYVDGALWKYESPSELTVGQEVTIQSVHALKLVVAPASKPVTE